MPRADFVEGVDPIVFFARTDPTLEAGVVPAEFSDGGGSHGATLV